ncbi:MAG: DMT family transporter [Firmicutes bacterium]|nr:DMT family transporter [Bacillota bacterium]
MFKDAYPTLAALTVAVIFGFSFLFTKAALFYLSPFQLIGIRFALAAFSLTALALLKVVKLNIRPRHLGDLLKIAIWQPVLYFICETYGVKLTSASESGVIIALVPVATAVLSMVILKEKITFWQGLFINAAVLGVVLMALGNPAAGLKGESGHLWGVLFLFGAVLAAAFYSIFSRRASAVHAPLDITFVMMWLGAVIFNIAGFIQSYWTGQLGNYIDIWHNLPVVVGILYLGILSSVIAFFLLNYTLSYLSASRAAVFLNLIPVVSVLAGILFLNEQLGSWQVGGGLLIILGVWGTNHFTWRPEKAVGGRAEEIS